MGSIPIRLGGYLLSNGGLVSSAFLVKWISRTATDREFWVQVLERVLCRGRPFGEPLDSSPSACRFDSCPRYQQLAGQSLMRFVIKSRRQAERSNEVETPHIIISVYTEGHEPPRLATNEHTRETLQLAFDDLDDPSFWSLSTEAFFGREPIYFSVRMADQIIDLVEKTKDDIDTIICHCDLGQSRSPAVAAALAKYFNGDDSEFFPLPAMYGSPRYCPNKWVYHALYKRLRSR